MVLFQKLWNLDLRKKAIVLYQKSMKLRFTVEKTTVLHVNENSGSF